MKPPSALTFQASPALGSGLSLPLFCFYFTAVLTHPLLRPNEMICGHLYTPRVILGLWLCLGSSPVWNDPTNSHSELELIVFCLMLWLSVHVPAHLWTGSSWSEGGGRAPA